MPLLGAFVPGIFEILIILFISVVMGIIPAIAFWRICVKAGFPGPLALLALIPPGFIALLFHLAFADWPALSYRDQGPSK